MCGISGLFDPKQTEPQQKNTNIVLAMRDSLTHRGPDDEGFWNDENIFFGQRRLSIIDLSPSGRQPMVSNSERFVLTYNGEIYNYKELKSELPQVNWRSTSDSEVLIESIEHWGLEKTLEKVNGMFAFALWDRESKTLTLARDRYGEKPLYYTKQNNKVYFASELKAFANLQIKKEIDRGAICLFVRHNCIPAPYTIYQDIYKLKPAHYIQFDNSLIETKPICYWSLQNTVNESVKNPITNHDEAMSTLHSALKDSVISRMISDVPVGALLSGGVDSSLVTALMQNISKNPVQTFSIGYDNLVYNEAKDAKKVAQHLGTNHTELYVTDQEAREVIPSLAGIYDEPFADSSQIPTLLVSKLASESVKVVLTGDGGDELFGGYTRHFWGQKVTEYNEKIPFLVRSSLGSALNSLSPKHWDAIYQVFYPLIPKQYRQREFSEKIYKLSQTLKCKNEFELYQFLTSHWNNPESLVINSKEPKSLIHQKNLYPKVNQTAEMMMYLDSLTYMPDDNLAKVDRASMSVSLEARVPFLDHKLTEVAWRIPFDLKIRGTEGKWALKQILYEYVPKELIERPKMGFSAPILDWIRGPLKSWACDLLNEDKLKREGFFDPAQIQTVLNDHLSGRRDNQYKLWDILMFQSWLEAQ